MDREGTIKIKEERPGCPEEEEVERQAAVVKTEETIPTVCRETKHQFEDANAIIYIKCEVEDDEDGCTKVDDHETSTVPQRRKRKINKDKIIRKIEERASCPLCQKTLSSKYALKYHLMKLHATNSMPEEERSSFVQCPDCDAKLKNTSALKRHERSMHSNIKPSVECSQCKKRFSNNYNLNYHVLRSHAGLKPFQCLICTRRFTSSGNLKHHVRAHEGIKPFACDICNCRFTSKVNLTKHTKFVHLKEKPCQCEFCGKTFQMNRDLKKHLIRHKNSNDVVDEGPHPCPKCPNKLFLTTQELEKHSLRIHNKYSRRSEEKSAQGEKTDLVSKYRCDICKQEYRNKTSLNLHVKIEHKSSLKCDDIFPDKQNLVEHAGHNPTTEEMRFSCAQCEKSFGTMHNLTRHIKVHSLARNFACSHCPKRFKTKSSLSDHEKIHSGLTRYSCNECDRKFITTYALKYHLNLHGDRRPYRCSVCDFRFRVLGHVNNHIRNKKVGHENAVAILDEDEL